MVQDDLLSLEIIDDGVGLKATDPLKEGSFGLRGLQERVRHAGGWVDVPVGLGHGLVMLNLPLTDAAADRLAREGDWTEAENAEAALDTTGGQT